MVDRVATPLRAGELPPIGLGLGSPAHEVVSDGAATPIEFTFRGKRFRIHAVLSRWCEAGGWWNRVSDGIYRPDDGARALWRVEAAPIGSLNTFELERDEITGSWIVKQV